MEQVIESASPGEHRRARIARRDVRIVSIVNLIPVLTVAGVIAYFVAGGRVTAFEWTMLVVGHLLGMVGMEVGYHRFFAHRTFKAAKWLTYTLGILGSMSFQGGVIWWVATHRRHHSFTDKPEDPHSPVAGYLDQGFMGRVRGIVHAHVGWMLKPNHLKPAGWERWVPDLFKDPLLFQLHVNYYRWGLLGLAIPALIGGLWYGTWLGALSGLVWGGLLRVFTCNHVFYATNSICHSFGSRMFPRKDHSHNNMWLVIVSIGLSLHNNHHAFPRSARLNFRWWQIDIAGALIKALSWTGAITEMTVATPQEVQAKRATIE